MKEKTKETEEFTLPDEVSKVNISSPRDLAIISIPKAGKGTIFGKFTEKYNAIILDLEKGGYEYIAARKLSTYVEQNTTNGLLVPSPGGIFEIRYPDFDIVGNTT